MLSSLEVDYKFSAQLQSRQLSRSAGSSTRWRHQARGWRRLRRRGLGQCWISSSPVVSRFLEWTSIVSILQSTFTKRRPRRSIVSHAGARTGRRKRRSTARWEPGEGHVGMAFQKQREFIAEDTSQTDAKQLLRRRRLSVGRMTWSATARSLRSPFGWAGGTVGSCGDQRRCGQVLSSEGGMDPARDPVEPLRALAREVALTLKLNDLYRGLPRAKS